MAEEKGGGGIFSGDAGLLLLLVVLGALALGTHGLGSNQKNGVTVGSPTSVNTVEQNIADANRPTYLFFSNASNNQNSTPSTSSSQNKISIYGSGARNRDPNQEYIDLYASSLNTGSIAVTGWTVENSKGEKYPIGSAAYLAQAPQISAESPILLRPGDILHIVTGQSPIGGNFRTNLCTGYFDQYNVFYPGLRENCPRPEAERTAANLNNACYDYLKTLPRCRQPQGAALKVDSLCASYANENLTYASCVDTHKNETDFFGNEWYVYLGRTAEIWKQERETIIVRNQSGQVMATYSY